MDKARMLPENDINKSFSRIRRYSNQNTFAKISLIALWLIVSVIGIALYNYNPVEFTYAPQCLFNKFTGLYCTGCGTARSLHALLHGKFLEAIDFNILTVASLPFLFYALIAETIRKFTRFKIRAVDISTRLIQLLLILIIIFTILRNIRIPAFSVIAP